MALLFQVFSRYNKPEQSVMEVFVFPLHMSGISLIILNEYATDLMNINCMLT